jgi:glycosyltransferase involved in cell wall biosynthesis
MDVHAVPSVASVDGIGKRIVFDFTDLVDFLVHQSQLSGIQRVQVDIYRKLKSHPDVIVFPVYFAEYPKRYFAVDADKLLALDRKYAKNLRRIHPTPWRKLSRRIDRLKSFAPRSGDIVFVAGAGWISWRRTAYLAALHKKCHIALRWMMYDLTPVTHPEFTTGSNVSLFRIWVDAALAMSAVFICISHFTREELLSYAATKGLQVKAVAVPLAHEFSPVQAAIRSRFQYLKNERLVLSVGPLEPRKNHLPLVRLWERLYREMGEDTPILALVGGRGWGNDRLRAFLRGTADIYGQVVRIHDASDAELAWLYEHCEFTIYPSLYEGWGLPVGESLWFGKPCICFRHSSLAEVGGSHAIFCDPYERNALEHAVRNAIAGIFPLRPPQRSQLRTWDAVANEMIQAICS